MTFNSFVAYCSGFFEVSIILFFTFCFSLLPLPRVSFSTDARTVSSGSSVWEGQMTSMVLSEYASTEMSIHALYMHEVSGQTYSNVRNTKRSAVSTLFQKQMRITPGIKNVTEA